MLQEGFFLPVKGRGRLQGGCVFPAFSAGTKGERIRWNGRKKRGIH